MSAKGYGGFNKIPMGESGGTVIAGRHHKEEEVNTQSPPASPYKNTPTKVTSSLIIPFEDRESRLRYLRAVKNYLVCELATVEAALTEEENR